MARRTKVLLTCLVLLALGLSGGVTWYYRLLRNTTNPLHLKVVKVETAHDGSKVVHFELTNTSWFAVKYTGTVSSFAQPLDNPLASAPVRVAIQTYPDAGLGPQVLQPKEAHSGTIPSPAAVSSSYTYMWEPRIAGRVRQACEALQKRLPDRLAKLVPTPFDIRLGECEMSPVPPGIEAAVMAR
jgi:hypothetical protein